jgi:hypothetical protein
MINTSSKAEEKGLSLNKKRHFVNNLDLSQMTLRDLLMDLVLFCKQSVCFE